MPNERKTIRDSIKTIIEGVVNYEVFTSRKIDGRNKNEFISIYFEQWDMAFDGLQNPTTAPLIIAFNTVDQLDDDLLDEVADAINTALEQNEIAPQLVQGFIPTGGGYFDESERAFSGIYLRYTVTY